MKRYSLKKARQLIASAGGKASAMALTPEQRSARAKKAVMAREAKRFKDKN